MQKRTFIGLILVLAMSLLLRNSAAAQDEAPAESPLLEMLSRVPNSPESRAGEMYFNDRAAITEAYPDAVMPESWEQFRTEEDIETPIGLSLQVWWRVFMNNSSSQLGSNLMAGEAFPETVGFDFFDVERELYYGRPPFAGLIIDGAFDRPSIREAFTVLGYVDSSIGDAEVWCAEAGCDTGMDTNADNVNRANPFGGELGRRQPLVIDDDYLMSSPDFLIVESHLDAEHGNKSSLAEVPEYIAGVEAISQFGPLIQAMIVDGELLDGLRSNVTGLFDAGTTAATFPSVRTELLQDFVALPVYQLLLIGDTATDDEHIGMVALVYDDVATAETARTVLEARINSYDSRITGRSMTDMLEERYLTLETSIYESQNLAVLLLQFAAPKGTGEEVIEVTTVSFSNVGDTEIPRPSAAYNWLYNMFINFDTGWVSAVTAEDIRNWPNN